MSEIKVNKISPKQTCTQLTLGDALDTIIIPANTTTSVAGTLSVTGNLLSDTLKNANSSTLITQTNATTITIGTTGQTVTLASGASQTGFGRSGTVNWDTTAKTSSPVTAVSGNGYFINTTSGAITVNLPSAVAGDIVAVSDYANTAATNNITIAPNGSQKIQGNNINYKITTNGGTATLVYVDSTQGWRPTDAATATSITEPPLFTTATGGTITTSGNYKIHTFTGPGTFEVTQLGNAPTIPTGGPNTVSYLVVAGGGGGNGGGGGAGGFREGRDITPSYTASPLVAPTGLTISKTSYPITVGAGGSGAPVPSSGNSSIFSTITSAGGGNADNGPGGSGGGSGAPGGSGGTGNTPPTSPSQGNNGGPGVNGQSGAGGGGAGAAGSPNNGPNNPGGAGGAGSATSITSSPVTYAGGGGGGANGGLSLTPGAGGPGGGGKGAGFPNSPSVAGTANTGGGGGGGGGSLSSSGGGSGIVIIRYQFQ